MESVWYLCRRDLVALVESHETCGNVAASMESHGQQVGKSGNLHGVSWKGVVETWQLPWSSALDAGLVE